VRAQPELVEVVHDRLPVLTRRSRRCHNHDDRSCVAQRIQQSQGLVAAPQDTARRLQREVAVESDDGIVQRHA
jgi:hypothetical protein